MSREWMWRIGSALVAMAVSYYTAQGAVTDRVTKIETRQDAQFEEIMRRMNEAQNESGEFRSEVRSDLRVVRGDILAVAKEMKR